MFTIAMEPQHQVHSEAECVEAKRNPISQSKLLRMIAMVGVMFIIVRLAPLTVAGVSAELHSLTVAIDGVANSKGVVGVLVFNSARGWPEHVSAAFRSKAVAAHEGRTELTITGLPTGDYAVVVLHDENENKKLDRNWLGKPTEQWGMSNNPEYFLSAPSFEESRFRLGSDERIHVKLH
jgi:uncharacterized protein (DUF2141 family)